MKIVLVNGSPRGDKSNTKVLTDWMAEGMNSQEHDFEIVEFFLSKRTGLDQLLPEIFAADIFILAFPLYTDAMPGIVKEFLEKLGDYAENRVLPPTAYIVQSGFPEGIHGSFVARYLKKYTHRIGGDYLGTVVKGGVEGVKIKPDWMTRKMKKRFMRLGAYLVANQRFSRRIIDKMQKPVKFSWLTRLILRLVAKTGLNDLYWNSRLKKNGAFADRYNTPALRSDNDLTL